MRDSRLAVLAAERTVTVHAVARSPRQCRTLRFQGLNEGAHKRAAWSQLQSSL